MKNQIRLVVSVFAAVSLGIMWRGPRAHLTGRGEATCMLWAEQAGVRHATSAPPTRTKAHFRTTWLVTAAGAVSGAAVMWVSEQQLVMGEGLGAGLSAVSCTLHFLGERVWVWVRGSGCGCRCCWGMSSFNTIIKRLLTQVLSVCSVLCKAKGELSFDDRSSAQRWPRA